MAWIDLAETAGIPRLLFQQFYDYLCGHCHSSFISVLQTRDAMNDPETQRRLAAAPSLLLAVSMARVIDSHCAVIPQAKAAFDKDPDLKVRVNCVHGIAAKYGDCFKVKAAETS